MKQRLLLILIASSPFTSCHTFVGKSGSKQRQLFPAKVRTSSTLDTNRFVRRPFDINDYTNKRGFENGKRIVEPIDGEQLQELAKSGGRYIVFFTYACPMNRAKIRKLERLTDSNNILLVSLTTDHNYIDSTLKHSRFAQYPYYTMEGNRYNRILIDREIRFIKDACPKCYDENRDDVRWSEYLIVENGSIRTVEENDTSNILNR